MSNSFWPEDTGTVMYLDGELSHKYIADKIAKK